jgi:hypothetical protein
MGQPKENWQNRKGRKTGQAEKRDRQNGKGWQNKAVRTGLPG